MGAKQVIYGVDFSGAQNAGKLVWLSRVLLNDSVASLDDCYCGGRLPGSALRREACLPALSRFIGTHGPEAAFGLDFPFSLPRKVLGEICWDHFVRSFAAEFPDCEAFRTECHRRGDGRELWRRTDMETRTPFSCYNLRLYKQTYFGVRDVIAPLLQSHSAWFAPMETEAAGKPCVIEICPASTLRRHGLAYGSYKGPTSAHAETRKAILEEVKRLSRIQIETAQLEDTIIKERGGNALDSLIAAWAVHKTLSQPENLVASQPEYAIEGRVYA